MNCLEICEDIFKPKNETLTRFFHDKLECSCFEAYENACQDQKFAFTDYYRTIYALFCNPDKYEESCNKSFDFTTDIYALTFVESLNFTFEPVKEMCKFTNSYINNETDYDEWFLDTNVFCKTRSMGMSRDLYDAKFYPTSEFMTTECYGSHIGLFIFLLLLAIFITVSNISVIIVLARDSFYHNSYGLYKFSLAIADLLIGIIVIPIMVTIKINVIFLQELPFRGYGVIPLSTDYFNQKTLDICGFFSAFSFMVSVYTLMASSIDRYLAVRWPIKYKQLITPVRVLTGVLLGITWIVGISVGLVPILKKNLRYAFGVAWMVLGVPHNPNDSQNEDAGSDSMMFYLGITVVPLVIVWFINGLTIWEIVGNQPCNCIRRKENRVESRRPSAFGHEKKQNQHQTFEMRIAKTFLAMTSAFTLAILPMGIITLWMMIANKRMNPNNPDYDHAMVRYHMSFDFIAGVSLMANSFHNCIIYTVRSPRFKRNLKEIFESTCFLCRSRLHKIRRSSLWSVLNEKRKSFSDTVTSRVHGSVESAEGPEGLSVRKISLEPNIPPERHPTVIET